MVIPCQNFLLMLEKKKLPKAAFQSLFRGFFFL